MLQNSVQVNDVVANDNSSVARGVTRAKSDSTANFFVKTDTPMLEPERTCLTSRADLPGENSANPGGVAHTSKKSFTSQTQTKLASDVTKARQTEHVRDARSSLGFQSDETSSGNQSAAKEGLNRNGTALPPGLTGTEFSIGRTKHADPHIILGSAAMRGEDDAMQDIAREHSPVRNDLAAPTRAFAMHGSTSKQFIGQESTANANTTFFLRNKKFTRGPGSSAPTLPTLAIASQQRNNSVHESNVYDAATDSTRNEQTTTTNRQFDVANRVHVDALANRSAQTTPDDVSSMTRNRQFTVRLSSSAPTLPTSWIATHDDVASDNGVSDSKVYRAATESTRKEHSISSERKSDRVDRVSVDELEKSNRQRLQNHFPDSSNGVQISRRNEHNDTTSSSEYRINTGSGQNQTSESVFADDNGTNKHDPTRQPSTFARETNGSMDASPPSSGTSANTLTEHAAELKLQRTRAKLDRLKRQQTKAQHDKDHYRLAFTVVAIEETETLVAELEKKLFKQEKVTVSDESPAVANIVSSSPGASELGGRTPQQNIMTSKRSSNPISRPNTTPERHDDNSLLTADSDTGVGSNIATTATSTAQEDDVESFLSRIRKEMRIEAPLVHAVKETAGAAVPKLDVKGAVVPAVPKMECKESAASSTHDGDKSREHRQAKLRAIAPVSDHPTLSSDAEDATLTDRRYSFPTLKTNSVQFGVKEAYGSLEANSLKSDSVSQNVSTTSTNIVHGSRHINDSHDLTQRTETAHEKHFEEQWDLVEAAAEMICRSNSPELEASSSRVREGRTEDHISKPLQTPRKNVGIDEPTAQNFKMSQQEYNTQSAHTYRTAMGKQIRNIAQQSDQQFDASNLENLRNQQTFRRQLNADAMHQSRHPMGVHSQPHRENFSQNAESENAYSRSRSLHIKSAQHREHEPGSAGANAFVRRYEDSLSPVSARDSVVPRRPEGQRGPERYPDDAPDFNKSGRSHVSTGNVVVSSGGDSMPATSNNNPTLDTPVGPSEKSQASVLTTPLTDNEGAKMNARSREYMFGLSPVKWPLDQFQTPMQRRVDQICAGASLHAFGRDLHLRLAGVHHFKLQQQKHMNTEVLLAALQSQQSSPPPPPSRLTVPSMTPNITVTTAPVTSISVALNPITLSPINMSKLDSFVSNVPSKNTIN